MSRSRRKYLKEAKQKRMRDLHFSVNGFVSLFCGIISIGLFTSALVLSFLGSGDGSYMVGGLGMAGLFTAIGAFLIGRISLKEKGIRPNPPKAGVLIGLICAIAYVIFIISGLG